MNATPVAVADTSARFQTSVTSGDATFTGFRDKLGYRFLGIDFADFEERFDYSTVINATGDVSALAIKPHCWQIDGITYSTDGVEHCLNLNIWTNYLPDGKDNSTALKPVFFWIHGGGLTSGYGSDPTWDGGNLASRGDIVVVTINYRLGMLCLLVNTRACTDCFQAPSDGYNFPTILLSTATKVLVR